MANLEYLAEVITRSINELARAKDAILAEMQRENAPRDVRLTRDEWAREMQLREAAQSDLKALHAPETKSPPATPTTPKKNN